MINSQRPQSSLSKIFYQYPQGTNTHRSKSVTRQCTSTEYYLPNTSVIVRGHISLCYDRQSTKKKKDVTIIGRSHVCLKSINKVKEMLNILPEIQPLIMCITIIYIHYENQKLWMISCTPMLKNKVACFN